MRNDRRLVEADGDWIVIEDRQPFHRCESVVDERAPPDRLDDLLWGPETGGRLVFTHMALSALIGLRIVLRPCRKLADTPDALFDPVPFLGFLGGMPSTWVIVALQVIGGPQPPLAFRCAAILGLTYAVAWVCYLVLAGLFGQPGQGDAQRPAAALGVGRVPPGPDRCGRS